MVVKQYHPGDDIGGEFRVQAVFGGEHQSGMGVVYLATNREIPFPIVLKTFQGNLSELQKQRFMVEARAWINAGAHPHLVQAYWVREIASQLFIAAEYIAADMNGRNTLAHYIAGAPVAIENIVRWAIQFCLGMEYAQSRGIVAHRDIKPANLMISPAGDLKVTDFGLSKVRDDDVETAATVDHSASHHSNGQRGSLTRAGSAIGTPPFMAPEQFGVGAVDHRSDIYAFGIVMYLLLTGGAYPYDIQDSAPGVDAFYDAHQRLAPRPVRSILWPLIEECLSKDPNKRFASYDALLDALRAVANEHGIVVTTYRHEVREDEELYAQAQSLLALGDSNGALKVINEYVALFPDRFCGWTEKGRIHLERGEYIASRTASLRSLAINPTNSHAWNNYGVALTQLSDSLEKIKGALNRAIRCDPLNTGAMLNLVGPMMDDNDLLGAATMLAQAIQIAPNKPLVMDKAGAVLRACFDGGRIDAADVLLAGWVVARPLDTIAWHNFGLVHLHFQRQQPATVAFIHVERLDPDDNFAVKQLARLFYESGQMDECIRRCDLLIARNCDVTIAADLRSIAVARR
jgi:serine/threonine protein kinase